MKRTVGILLLALGVATIVLLSLKPANEHRPAVNGAGSVVNLPAYDLPSSSLADSASDDGANDGPQSRTEHIDRMIARGYMDAHYREVLIAADNDSAWRALWDQFYVIPNTREAGESLCHPLETPDGKRICWDHYGFHPYLAIPIEDLRAMAGDDPAAADALSVLLPTEERDERMYYAMQAAYLSGKPGPLYRFSLSMAPAGADHQRRLEQYALIRLADALGTPVYRARAMEENLERDLGVTNAELREAARETIPALFERAREARNSS